MAEYETRSLHMAGIWWMPNTDNETLGTLRWIPNVGCVLELVDDSHEFRWGESPGIVWGLNSEQDPITLLGCRYAGGGTIKSSGNAMSYGHRVAATTALVGGLFENEADAALTDLYAGFAGLDEYVMQNYFDVESEKLDDGRFRAKKVTFTSPEYELAKIGDIEVGLYVGWSANKDLIPHHKLHISFPQNDGYKSDGASHKLIQKILPAFLGAIMGHPSFLTSLTSQIDNAPVEVFDDYNPKMSWQGDPDLLDRLVLGRRRSIDLWPAILPRWVQNYQAIANLCSAYIKIMFDGRDGYFERNNLVHIFFGLEAYYKDKCNLRSGSLGKALKYTICRIRSYFQNVEEYIRVLESIDIDSLSHARQVLVHSNKGNPNYTLVYQQLLFITRCVLLMEMEYPVCSVENDTSHWELWHFFADRRKPKEAKS